MHKIKGTVSIIAEIKFKSVIFSLFNYSKNPLKYKKETG
jgi:hypothetical protein